MKDRGLKDVLLRHFAAQGAIVQPEVVVHCPGGVAATRKVVTDVDVFALRPQMGLRFEKILGDCRTLASQSPINRVLWLRGLMELLHADVGYVLLDVVNIENDHKFVANSLNVRLLAASEFESYDRAVVYPAGSDGYEVSASDVLGVGAVSEKFPFLRRLTDYLYHTAWQEEDFGAQIRHTIGQVRSAARELDPGRSEHAALVCDAAAIFAVAIAQCIGSVFHQYLKPSQKQELAEALKITIWGGRESYSFYETVRRRMLRQRRVKVSNGNSLELPQWEKFVQLTREMLEYPAGAFAVPSILREMAVALCKGQEPSPRVSKDQAVTLKFAMLVVEYLCDATAIPREFAARLGGLLVNLQGELFGTGAKTDRGL